MNFVLDASIALSWCFEDEATANSNTLLEKLQTHTAFVPGLWSLEVGNILIAAARRKRITYAGVTQFVELIRQLNIETDNETSGRGFHEILALAHSEKLTTYDAAYLELAMRLGLPLASKDNDLRAAAVRVGVKVLSV